MVPDPTSITKAVTFISREQWTKGATSNRRAFNRPHLYIGDSKVLEPVPTSPPPPPLPREEVSHTDRLLERVRAAQRRALWLQGTMLGVAAVLPLFLFGALLSTRVPLAGRLVVMGALPAGLFVFLYCGL